MTAIRRFFAGDAAGAIVLLAATIAALLVANSPLAPTYVATLHHAVGGLAFAGAPHAMNSVKIGVFAGSILSGIAGWILLRRSAR